MPGGFLDLRRNRFAEKGGGSFHSKVEGRALRGHRGRARGSRFAALHAGRN